MSSTYVRGLVSAGSSLARNRFIAFHLVSHLSWTDRGSHLSCGRSARWWPAAAASAFSTAVIASSRCPRTGSHPVNLWLQTKSPSVHEGQPRQPTRRPARLTKEQRGATHGDRISQRDASAPSEHRCHRGRLTARARSLRSGEPAHGGPEEVTVVADPGALLTALYAALTGRIIARVARARLRQRTGRGGPRARPSGTCWISSRTGCTANPSHCCRPPPGRLPPDRPPPGRAPRAGRRRAGHAVGSIRHLNHRETLAAYSALIHLSSSLSYPGEPRN